jgi:hypothetical protein
MVIRSGSSQNLVEFLPRWSDKGKRWSIRQTCFYEKAGKSEKSHLECVRVEVGDK